MSGRHRPFGGEGGGRASRAPIAFAAVAALVALTVVAVRAVAADANGCSKGITLSVAAAPDIAPVVRDAATRWTAGNPKVNGDCVKVQVSATEPADVANMLAVRAGTRINVAASPVPTPSDADIPSVWIPDSVSWLVRVQSVNKDAFDNDAPSLAVSPVVLAMPEQLARALQGDNPHRLTTADLGALLQKAFKGDKTIQVGVSEPRRNAVGLAGASLMYDTVVTAPAQLPILVGTYRAVTLSSDAPGELKAFGQGQTVAPLSEQAVLAYDATNPAVPLAAAPLATPAALDYPYALVAGKPRAITRAAEQFRQVLLDPRQDDLFAKAGFRLADGSVPQGFPAGHGVTTEPVQATPLADAAKIADVLSIWTASKTPSRVLALADVTSSMAQPMPGSTTVNRMQVMQGAAVGGLQLFTDDSEVGLWGFAAGIGDGGVDYRQLVPLGRLGADQRKKLATTVNAAAPAPTNVCGLYDTVLAAYKVMKDGYQEDHSNTIVVFTDSANSKPGSMPVDQLQLELEKLTDTTKPIRVVLLGIGPDVNIDELTAIAKTTGGKAFKVDNPAEIGTIFLQALLRTST